MDRRLSCWIVALALLALASAGRTLAADTKTTPLPEPTAEQRQKVAEVHQKMAECLRSTRPIAECRSEMAAACQGLGAGTCPMMSSMPVPKPIIPGPPMPPPGMMQGPPTSIPQPP